MSLPVERTPVIVGVGEVIDRPDNPVDGREPAVLMAAALAAAENDARSSLLSRLDALLVVNQVSWGYADLPARVAELAGTEPAYRANGPIGGETPLRLLNDAALRIVRGESAAVAVVSGEAQYSVDKARAAQVPLAWTPPDRKEKLTLDYVHPVAARHLKLGGLVPSQIYPFYETATAAAWGLSPAAAQAETGALWARLSAVAASNPSSWSKRPFTAEEIVTPAPDNRMIAWPYTKRMVANPAVNQAAAVLVTSLGMARAAGVLEDQIIHIWGGAAANEPRDYLSRDRYDRSSAQEIVLQAALEIAQPVGLGPVELYSCFPVVPKMARRTLGFGDDVEPTVTGGLSFFGAPLNGYMTHAAAAMVRRLRADGARPGLLYGQGEFVTKHHALVLGRNPCPADRLSRGYDRQADATERMGPVPTILESYEGDATIEAFTIVFAPEGAPEFGTVIARTPGGERLMARVSGSDAESLAVLMAAEQSPVGRSGEVRAGDEALLFWRVK